MHIAKEDVPLKIGAPGVAARQQVDFGDATGYGKISGEFFSMPAGMDISPLLQGLEGNLCQSPHWGYVIKGAVTVSYSDGTQEAVRANDIFYWPPGHTVRVDEAADVILFSPQHEHTHVLDHMIAKMNS
jgi:hypothetical protein